MGRADQNTRPRACLRLMSSFIFQEWCQLPPLSHKKYGSCWRCVWCNIYNDISKVRRSVSYSFYFSFIILFHFYIFNTQLECWRDTSRLKLRKKIHALRTRFLTPKTHPIIINGDSAMNENQWKKAQTSTLLWLFLPSRSTSCGNKTSVTIGPSNNRTSTAKDKCDSQSCALLHHQRGLPYHQHQSEYTWGGLNRWLAICPNRMLLKQDA